MRADAEVHGDVATLRRILHAGFTIAYDSGKILEVWRKQPDGGWKCAADTWSSDLPASP